MMMISLDIDSDGIIALSALLSIVFVIMIMNIILYLF